MENLRNDLDAPKGAHLMGPYEEGSLNIVTLLLTGRATPYLHNGVVYVGDEDHYVSMTCRLVADPLSYTTLERSQLVTTYMFISPKPSMSLQRF